MLVAVDVWMVCGLRGGFLLIRHIMELMATKLIPILLQMCSSQKVGKIDPMRRLNKSSKVILKQG